MPKNSTGKNGCSAIMQKHEGIQSPKKHKQFDPLERNWGSKGTNSNQSQIQGGGCSCAGVRSSSNSMLDRWKDETMTDQPYNTIGAVSKNQHNSADAAKTSTGSKNWSISNQDPKSRS